MAPKRIALYGNFGSGNIGNECTLQAVTEQLRLRWPDARLTCLCTIPEDVRSRHGMKAVRAAVTDSGWSWADLDRDPLAPAPARAQPPRWLRIVSKVLRLAFRRIPLELAHWIRGFALLARCDLLIVPGTQVVSDYLCGPGSWPYDIYKWSTLARLCRVKLIFLSVGVGPIGHPLSRRLIARSLAGASYRSYRDRESQSTAERIGLPARTDPLFPDLAFGLSAQSLPAPTPHSGARRVIGVGVKNLPGVSDAAAADAYARYLDTTADFIAHLQQRGYAVRLLIGDLQYDIKPRSELLQAMRRKGVATEAPHLLVDDPRSVDDLLRQLEETDVVVSPRLHNLILALLLGRPVIALSDHSKLDRLLAELELSDYRVALEPLRLETLLERFESVERYAGGLRTHIRGRVERYRLALEEQYERVFAAGAAPDAAAARNLPPATSARNTAAP